MNIYSLNLAFLLVFPTDRNVTFSTFYRSSATRAADAGASTEQLVDFFGWKNGSMCHEYVSSSKPAILGMANRLAGSGEVHKEVLINKEEEDKLPVMEEDPEMYSKAGIPLSTTITNLNQQGAVETSIKQVMSSLPAVNGGNISLKFVVVTNQTGNVNM